MGLPTLLSVCVQHHIARPDLPARLLGLLGETVEIVADPAPFGPASPWRTYRHALQQTPPDATHRLILQDDAMPCEGFLDAARTIASLVPARPVAFYVGTHCPEHHRIKAAAQVCQPWVELRPLPWVPLVAMMWPAADVAGLVEIGDRERWQRDHVADDEVAGTFVAERYGTYLATVPSLVQHDDEQPSTMAGHRKAGMRRAACWIGAHHASVVDWTRGLPA